MATVETENEALFWQGALGYEGVVTSDRRYLMPGGVTERELPLTLMALTETSDAGHVGAQVAGKITEIWREPQQDGSVTIMGRGVFDNSDFGREVARMVDEEVLRGISFDLATGEVVPLHPDTLEPVDTDSMGMEELLFGDFVTGVKGQIMGATIVPFPAFEEASLQIVRDEGGITVTASANLQLVQPAGFFTKGNGEVVGHVFEMTASATVTAPPLSWFENPELAGPTPITYTKEGRVYGHLALWDSCHTGFTGVCVSPPASPTDYSYFNVGVVATDNGPVTCGKLMFSTDGGKHADLRLNAQEASKHYDDATKIGAHVRAMSDSYGIVLAGALKPGITDAELEHLRANPPSGDWRGIGGHSELVAAFSVPVPAFPIPQAEARLVASAGMDEIAALIIGPLQVEDQPRSRKRKLKMLSDRAHR